MKNFILFIVMTLGLVTMSTAQSTIQEVTATVDSVSKEIPKYQEITEYYMDKTKEALEGLAQALEVPVKEVWRILVMQQVADSVTWLILLAVSFYFLRRFILFLYKLLEDNDDDNGSGMVAIMGILVFGILFIISCLHIDTIVTGFINPEYGALMEIKDFFKYGL